MKNMKNFAAQQLSKKQMNEVKGGQGGFDNCGVLYYCEWEGGQNYACEKETTKLATLIDSGANCNPA